MSLRTPVTTDHATELRRSQRAQGAALRSPGRTETPPLPAEGAISSFRARARFDEKWSRATRRRYLWWLIVPVVAHAVLIPAASSTKVEYDVHCVWYDRGDPLKTPVHEENDSRSARPFGFSTVFDFTCSLPLGDPRREFRLSKQTALSRVTFEPRAIDGRILISAMLPALVLLWGYLPTYGAAQLLANRAARHSSNLRLRPTLMTAVSQTAVPFGLALWLFLAGPLLHLTHVVVFPDVRVIDRPQVVSIAAALVWLAAAILVPYRLVMSDAGRVMFARPRLALGLLWALTLGSICLLVFVTCAA